jgi:ethanolaminephosphotransferase
MSMPAWLDERAAQRIRAPRPCASDDRSWISRLLEPFWSAVAARTPPRLAPNAITLMGFAAVTLSFALMLVVCPRLDGTAPRITSAVAIVAIFVFQTLDAVDGKQARRTGSSSSLGNWLDHVCDVVAIQMAMATAAAALGLGAGGLSLFLLGSVAFNNFVIHWETKHTRTLVMGNGTSIYDAQLTLVLVHAITLAFGSGLWAARLDHLVPALAGVPFADAALRAWIVLLGVGLIGGIGVVQSMVRVVRQRPASERVRVFVDLVPAVCVVTAGGLASFAARGAGGGEAADLALTFTTSLLGLRLIGRIILEDIAELPPRPFDPALVPILATAALFLAVRAGLAPRTLPIDAIACAGLVFALGASARMLLGATFSIARVLGIPILTLPRAKR